MFHPRIIEPRASEGATSVRIDCQLERLGVFHEPVASLLGGRESGVAIHDERATATSAFAEIVTAELALLGRSRLRGVAAAVLNERPIGAIGEYDSAIGSGVPYVAANGRIVDHRLELLERVALLLRIPEGAVGRASCRSSRAGSGCSSAAHAGGSARARTAGAHAPASARRAAASTGRATAAPTAGRAGVGVAAARECREPPAGSQSHENAEPESSCFVHVWSPTRASRAGTAVPRHRKQMKRQIAAWA